MDVRRGNIDSKECVKKKKKKKTVVLTQLQCKSGVVDNNNGASASLYHIAQNTSLLRRCESRAGHKLNYRFFGRAVSTLMDYARLPYIFNEKIYFLPPQNSP